MRALARDLGVSAAFVSQVFSGKKKLSFERAMEIGESLGLPKGKMALLLQSVALDGAKNPASKAVLSQMLGKDDRETPEFHPLDIDRFKLLGDWYHLAVLELTTTKGFRPDIAWIAKRLRIGQDEARDAVDRLERLGLLRIDGGHWEKTKLRITFPTERSHAAVRVFHEQMIEKSLGHLSDGGDEAFSKRDISGITLTLDPGRMDEAKAVIRDFRRKMASLVAESECTEVYQLNIQLFNLTEEVRE